MTSLVRVYELNKVIHSFASEMMSWKWIAAVAGGASLATLGVACMAYSLRKARVPKGHKGLLDDQVLSYIADHNVESDVLSKLRAISIKHARGKMTSSSDVGKLLMILCRATNARKVIDIGVFTGCSAFAMAQALPEDGKVIACDVSEEFTSIGKPYWDEGGIANKIDLRIQPAATTLQELVENKEDGTFDVVFIDADKPNYTYYYEMAIKLLRRGGCIVVDNALWSGKVADHRIQDQYTVAIRSLNETMKNDPRVDFVLLSISDGIGLAQKL